MRRALFLDRDGVINVDRGYVFRHEDVAYCPGIDDLLAAAMRHDFCVIVVTNQSGIARGLYSEADHRSLTAAIHADVALRGLRIDATYFCPHHPTAGEPPYRQICACRKPAPGMILKAAEDFDLDLKGSALVGDKASDVKAARRAGVGFAIRLANAAEADGAADITCHSLAAVTAAFERFAGAR